MQRPTALVAEDEAVLREACADVPAVLARDLQRRAAGLEIVTLVAEGGPDVDQEQEVSLRLVRGQTVDRPGTERIELAPHRCVAARGPHRLVHVRLGHP